MRVRIRLSFASATGAFDRKAALILSSLMTPVALMAWALGGWRLMADMRWTGEFAIREGIFSRWQVWVAIGIAAQFFALVLHRYARRDGSPLS